MSLTTAQARDEIFTMFNEAWDAAGHTVEFPNKEFTIPTTDDATWARVMADLAPSGSQSLANGLGKNRYTREGILTIQVFVPFGKGLLSADNSTKLIQDIFEGKSSPNGVWFRNIRTQEIGPDGSWYQVNITIDLEYDEIK